MSSEVKKFFEVTQNYLHKDFGVAFRRELISKEIGSISGKKILDIGCGNGSISMPYVMDNELTLLDFSENMLNLVRKSIPSHRKEQVVLLNKDFFELKEKGVYDIVLFIGVIAHVQRPLGECLNFLKDILKPNGEIYFQYTDNNNWIAKIDSYLRRTKYDINRTTKELVEKEATKSGLIISKRVRYAGILPGMGKLPNSSLLTYVRITSKFKFLDFLKSEYIYVLKKP